ncbi:unnamed protein product [Tilletia controversa]|uniref:Uncharacterized protein n=3 Tax=Tilletia TaxID=13289 RepID=A0A8X7MVA6_9BASI|nr:hypothetical protein CF336_g2925 [Tilletia laevis]KAE8201245.1 hypothetical protein CF328_g2730 [Tilletia controversa]KAE8262649.1 hypothetical protein A4X03_0g2294 [Tilletia caries]KAE8206038.1 hypothetical protein CF335_g2097 [Tilletia laevis]KAE8248949.1 hypothetical protein A4X06_0g3453 [Tilletia controversa]
MSASLPKSATAPAPATVVRTTGPDATYAVRLCSSAEDLRTAHRIRVSVFHEEQGFPAESEIDEYDPLSAHFLAIATSKSTGESRAVGTIRWVPYPFPPADPNFQPGADPALPIGPVRDQATVRALFAANKLDVTPGNDKEDEYVKQIKTAPTLLAGGKLTRLALAKEARGLRIGELLVRESERWVLDAVRGGVVGGQQQQGERLHSSKLVLSSQMPVINFYTRLSYVPVGDVYDEEGAPHQRLEKTVVF